MLQRPKVLSISGFDPSGGAGLTADLKTFETLKVYGLGVVTVNTIQTDKDFKDCIWTDVKVIQSQIEMLFQRFQIDVVKIGLIENWKVLEFVIYLLIEKNPNVKIVLDPILKSSTNYSFHQASNGFHSLLDKIFLLTPNYLEFQQLFPDKNKENIPGIVEGKTNIILKGGHNNTNIGTDQLFDSDGNIYVFHPSSSDCSEKHGSGCVLASSIAAYMALGKPLDIACNMGKQYTERFLASNNSLLGYHS